MLIVGAIALVIYMARQMGYTWEEIGGVVGGVFGLMYAYAKNNFVAPAWNIIAAFANFLGNFTKSPLAATKALFLDLATSILGYFPSVAHGMEDLINKIPGLHVNLTSGIDRLYDKVAGAAQKVKDENGFVEYMKPLSYEDYSQAWSTGSQMGRSMGKKLDEFSLQDFIGGFSNSTTDYASMLGDIGSALGDISNDTSAIKRSVSLSEEDIKMLVDMAEWQYINNINLIAQTPVITINGQNTGDTEEDLRWLENALQRILVEQAASHTDLSYV